MSTREQRKVATMSFTKIIKAASFVAAGLILVAQLSVVEASIIIESPKFPKDKPSASIMGEYGKGAVAANGPECAEIGKNMLERNGSAVDAAIATLLCEGVVSVHSMGLGGGFLMTIWDAENKNATFLDAREKAPSRANENMFQNQNESMHGGKSIAVPGELSGYRAAHRRYGRLPWKELFKPTIEICKRGSIVNKYIADSLRSVQHLILEQPSMAEILIDPKTNQTWKIGDRIKRPKLAETLEKLSNGNPMRKFYRGDMAHRLVKEIQEMGGIMENDDFLNYRAEWEKPTMADLDSMTLYSAPPPGSGEILGFIMSVLKDLLPTREPEVFWQRLIETFKWGYARRSELGDPHFVDIKTFEKNLSSIEYIDYVRKSIRDDWTSDDTKYYGADSLAVNDSGTANICVYAPDGSAVVVTSTINQYLGAMRRSPSTGIIFNDEMDDFSSSRFQNGFLMPPSESNFIKPGKRPMSSMAPSIIVDKKTNTPRMLVGSAGGTKITTAIATTMALHLYAGFNIKEAIDARRAHHQLFPMTVDYEVDFDQHILSYLVGIGHFVSTHPRMGSTVTAITVENGPGGSKVIRANSDGRREGHVDGY